MATEEKLNILTAWLKDNQVEYDQENIDIRMKDGSFGVYAVKNLPTQKTGKHIQTIFHFVFDANNFFFLFF